MSSNSNEPSPFGCGMFLFCGLGFLLKFAPFIVLAGIIISELASPGCEKRKEERRVREIREMRVYEEPLPPSGSVRRYKSSYLTSPLEIHSSADANYLLKLVDVYTSSTAVEVFVRAGDVVTVQIPDGTYEIRYASGSNWYGHQRLFGPGTGYSKAEKRFTFSAGKGYSITLYRMVGGNLRTKGIDPDDF